MNRLKRYLSAAWELFVTYAPGETGQRIRTKYWRPRLRHLGEGVLIDPGVLFQNPEFIELHDECWIDRGVIILAGCAGTDREIVHVGKDEDPGPAGVVSVGKRVHLAPNVLVSGITAGVRIGDDCGIGAGGKLYAFSHHLRSIARPTDRNISFTPQVPLEQQCMIEGQIVLGKNVGVAVNGVLLPGARIGEDSFVLAGSLVSGQFEPNSLIAGTPARRIGSRFPEENE